jgi:hypothetical protein
MACWCPVRCIRWAAGSPKCSGRGRWLLGVVRGWEACSSLVKCLFRILFPPLSPSLLAGRRAPGRECASEEGHRRISCLAHLFRTCSRPVRRRGGPQRRQKRGQRGLAPVDLSAETGIGHGSLWSGRRWSDLATRHDIVWQVDGETRDPRSKTGVCIYKTRLRRLRRSEPTEVGFVCTDRHLGGGLAAGSVTGSRCAPATPDSSRTGRTIPLRESRQAMPPEREASRRRTGIRTEVSQREQTNKNGGGGSPPPPRESGLLARRERPRSCHRRNDAHACDVHARMGATGGGRNAPTPGEVYLRRIRP